MNSGCIGRINIMAQYEYKFVEPPRSSLLGKQDDFEKCKDVIVSETKNGWRLKQVVVPYQEKCGAYFAKGYEIILEKETSYSTI
jgi:hypothetical protein